MEKIRIETNRLILREYVAEDWSAVLAYQSDPQYLQYTQWTARLPAEVQQFVRMFIEQQQDAPRSRFDLAVTLKNSGVLIGSCGIRLKPGLAKEGELGYEIAPAHWGNGYATEAASAMVAWGFRAQMLHRISAWCVVENEASARVLRKIGMQLEGTHRDREYFRDRWWTVHVFALLETDSP